MSKRIPSKLQQIISSCSRRLADHLNSRLSVFTICLALILFFCIKDPKVFFSPTFAAEEMSVFFKNAYVHGFWSGLTFYYERSCRFEIITTIAVSIATLFPLQYAPIVTATFAFIVFFVAILVVLKEKILGLTTSYLRLLMAFAFLLSCYSLGEIFLNTGTIHPTIGALVFFILMINAEALKKIKQFSYHLLLLLAGMSGTYGDFLAPAFILKAVHTKKRFDIIQAIIISLTTIFQVVLLIISSDHRHFEDNRGQFSVDSVGTALKVLILKTIAGEGLTSTLFSLIASHSTIQIIVAGSLLIMSISWIYFRANNFMNWLVLFAWLCESGGILLGAAGGVPDKLYASVSRTILFFFIIINIGILMRDFGWELRKKKLLIAELLVFVAMAISGLTNGLISHFKPYSIEVSSVPSWFEQVRDYEKNEIYNFVVYPASRWRSTLFYSKAKRDVTTVIPDSNYLVKDLKKINDYYLLRQPLLPRYGVGYVTISPLVLNLVISEKGNYKLQLYASPYEHLNNGLVGVKIFSSSKAQKLQFNINIENSQELKWNQSKTFDLDVGSYVVTIAGSLSEPVAITALKFARE